MGQIGRGTRQRHHVNWSDLNLSKDTPTRVREKNENRKNQSRPLHIKEQENLKFPFFVSFRITKMGIKDFMTVEYNFLTCFSFFLYIYYSDGTFK